LTRISEYYNTQKWVVNTASHQYRDIQHPSEEDWSSLTALDRICPSASAGLTVLPALPCLIEFATVLRNSPDFGVSSTRYDRMQSFFFDP
jgi:hypothetical protein